jgi:hypothetical protein
MVKQGSGFMMPQMYSDVGYATEITQHRLDVIQFLRIRDESAAHNQHHPGATRNSPPHLTKSCPMC